MRPSSWYVDERNRQVAFVTKPSSSADRPVEAIEGVAGSPGARARAASAEYKQIPATKATRDRIRAGAEAISASLDRTQRLTRATLERTGRQLLDQLALPHQFLGFAMVAVCNEYWRDEFMATEYRHRLLLLPRCLHSSDCQPAAGSLEESGGGNGSGETVSCDRCGKCCIAEFKQTAERLGYRVHVADGTPRVMSGRGARCRLPERVGKGP